MSTIHHLISLGCLLCCLNQAATANPHLDDAYSHDAHDSFTDKSRWMKSIRDDVQLSELALPGTHDSATFDVSLFPVVDDIVVTQTLNFDEQLRYGIRVLDLRIRRTGDVFALHHGPVFLDKMFGSALRSVERFLQANPSETVLFRVKEEHAADSNVTASLVEVFDHYMKQFSSTYLKAPRKNITLGEARGKFVVLSNIANLNPYGLSYGNFDIQDDSTLQTNWELHEKWLKIRRQLHRAAAGDKHMFYVNYLSGSVGAFPYFVASGHVSSGTGAPRLSTGLLALKEVDWYPFFPRTTCVLGVCTISFEGTNTLARDDIKDYNGPDPIRRTVGIIMADFPGESLIANIIANNHHPAHELGQ
ncbi:phosphatidylinositol-specific phospholipase C [Pseudomonas alkylphenolica]|uniref:phosphatidylinositol-specific phospholipase C n=1 Tax=Pseudomonas alkylphenolica TaxID=237609 RepID=UPI0018D5C894|nr:phosphatidylinositol-specific phospholipase C [Pseudomonas alkylphenolica]MBH3426971.1 phosphatidylinositol-specific phospholipase C [Pseudomonas alkylphenolica]